MQSDEDYMEQTPQSHPPPKDKEPPSRISYNHLRDNILGKLDVGIRLRKIVLNQVFFVCVICHMLNLRKKRTF